MHIPDRVIRQFGLKHHIPDSVEQVARIEQASAAVTRVRSLTLTLADGVIKLMRFKARISLNTPLRIHELVLGDHSVLDYSACWCARQLPACFCTWAGVGNISTQSS